MEVGTVESIVTEQHAQDLAAELVKDAVRDGQAEVQFEMEGGRWLRVVVEEVCPLEGTRLGEGFCDKCAERGGE